jgi:hypothetical protein
MSQLSFIPENDLEHDLAPLVKAELALPLPSVVPMPGTEVEQRMKNIEADLLTKAGGSTSFKENVGQIIREAVDYVIDAPTLARYNISDLEPDEKTAIGKRIERLIRHRFKIQRGKSLDLSLAGEDVDIKTTMSNKWMFSTSSWGKVNLLIAYDEKKATFKAGLVFVRSEQLGAENRDTKRTLKSKFYEEISWIVQDEKYPNNFFSKIPTTILEKITSLRYGQHRINALFELVHGKVIPRHVIPSLANQQDALKRIRRNGGARTTLWKKGFLILSGTYTSDRDIAIAATNIALQRDEFISIRKDDASITPPILSSYCDAHGILLDE